MALNGSLTSVKRSSETASVSRTVSPEKSRESWNERPSPRRARADAVRPVTSTPASSTRPLSARKNPEMTSNSVVLPAPLGPMIPRTSPCVACSDTSSSAALPPKASEIPRTSRSWRSRCGAAATAACVPKDSDACLR